jgi:hypothetical protein
MVVDNHEYYQTDGAQRPRGSAAITGSEVRAITGATVSDPKRLADHGERSDPGEPDATGRAGLGRHVVSDGIRQLF